MATLNCPTCAAPYQPGDLICLDCGANLARTGRRQPPAREDVPPGQQAPYAPQQPPYGAPQQQYGQPPQHGQDPYQQQPYGTPQHQPQHGQPGPQGQPGQYGPGQQGQYGQHGQHGQQQGQHGQPGPEGAPHYAPQYPDQPQDGRPPYLPQYPDQPQGQQPQGSPPYQPDAHRPQQGEGWFPPEQQGGRFDPQHGQPGRQGHPGQPGPLPPRDAYASPHDGYPAPQDAFAPPRDPYAAPPDPYAPVPDAFAPPPDPYAPPQPHQQPPGQPHGPSPYRSTPQPGVRREETLIPPEERPGGQQGDATAFMCPHCEAVLSDPAALQCGNCLRPVRQGTPVLRLVFPTGEVKVSLGQHIVLGRDAGQSPVATTFAQYDNVSRRHSTVWLDPSGTAWVRDERSTNGTFVNGERLPPGVEAPLHDGDTIRLAADAAGSVHLS